MELSGELVAGRFFAGVNSLQFASPSIGRELERAESFDGLHWMNAADPASPAGLGIEGLDPRIPGRLASNRIYFRGDKIVATAGKGGKELCIFIEPDEPDAATLVELLKIPRTRKVFPERKILIERINSVDATQSEYSGIFRAGGFVPDRGRLCFW